MASVFTLASRLVRGDEVRGEEVRGRDTAEVAPVLTIGSEPDGAREHELPRRPLHGAVFEGRVREHLTRTTAGVSPTKNAVSSLAQGPAAWAIDRGTARRCCRTRGRQDLAPLHVKGKLVKEKIKIGGFLQI
jgi:hypothetical protein